MITVAIIDDNRLVRDGLTALLDELDDVSVVFAGTSEDVALLTAAEPRVVLLDIGLRDANCISVAKRIKAELSAAETIVMDLLPVHDDLAHLVNVGVAGFILKDATLEELLETIRSVADGHRVLPQRMTGTLFSQIARLAVQRDREQTLDSIKMTKRESEVIALIADGLSNKEIAGRLNIATHTVKSHVRNVMEKLTLHSRLQIAAYAHRKDE